MSYRGGDRGRGRGGGSSFSRGGMNWRNYRGRGTTNLVFTGRGNFGGSNYGPPAAIIGMDCDRLRKEIWKQTNEPVEVGTFKHACGTDMVYESTNPKIPYFNADIFLENKTKIGKIDEILGPINQVFFTVKPQEGIVSTSFKAGDKVFISSDRLLPLEKFLPKPKPLPGAPKPKRIKGPNDGVGGRGGRGGFRGRGAPRGGPPRGRGGFGDRGGHGGRGGFSGAPRGGGFSRGAPYRGRGGFRGRGSY